MNKTITECGNPEEMISVLRAMRIRKARRTARLRILAMICAVSTLLLIITVYAKSTKPDTPVVYRTIIIEPGDTLWELAKKYYPNTDIRSAIYEIKKVNGMKSSTLLEGQQLKVPDDLTTG